MSQKNPKYFTPWKPYKGNGMKWGAENYWQTRDYNSRLFTMLQNQVISMAINRYKWVNLPENCDQRFLELTLFNQGIASIAINPENDEWYSLQVGGEMRAPDHYGNPSLWTTLGVNGKVRFTTTKANGIYVYDNSMRIPIIERISLWVREMVDIIRTLQQNRAHMKVPVLITGIQDKRLDMTNYIKQVAGGEAFIVTTDGINNIDVRAMSTDVDSYQTELWESFFNVWNQIYQSLGIGNLPFKAERRIEDEVQSQADPTNLVALDGLQCRRYACKFLNENFGDLLPGELNVVWNKDIATDNYNFIHDLQKMVELDEEGSENEPDGITGIPNPGRVTPQ